MAKKKQDVKPEETEASTVSEEQDVKQESQETTEDTSTQETLETKETQEESQPQEALDERGVPWRNVAAEKQRKLDELAERLPQIIEDKLSHFGEKKEQKRSVSELEAFAQQSPEYRPWVEEEKAKLQREEFVKITDERLKKADEKRSDDLKKQQSLNYAMQTYPQCFLKDNKGNVVGWNNNDPLTKEVGVLMRDKRLSNQPEGLMIAVDVAFARSMRTQMQQSKEKEKGLKSEVKELQKKTMIEGEGVNSAELPLAKKAIERLKDSGSLKDAQAAVSEIFKSRRRREEE